jgi:hypothetical protein
MKQIVKDREDIVFYIKMFPLKTHPGAYKKSKSIVCEKSLRLLERAFDGKKIREPRCETTELDDNIELTKRLGITGTPTVILPDGGIIPGYKDAEALLKLIDNAAEEMRAAEFEEVEEPEAGEELEAAEEPEAETGAYGAAEEEEPAEEEVKPDTQDTMEKKRFFRTPPVSAPMTD